MNSNNAMKLAAEQRDDDGMLFSERYAAAQSLKSAWTRLASTYGCMNICLSRSSLIIRPHWFARWLISLLGLDLFHEIPLENIRGVIELGRWSDYGKVKLHYQTTEGEDREIVLYLKKHREFVEELADAISR